MANYRSTFFAFPNEPPELKAPILAAVAPAETTPSIAIKAWPHLPIFGASIPDEVKAAVEKADVLICDITRPNLNVYYEIGFSVGASKSIAPVLNVSFANAAADIQKDGLFDVVGYRAYENSAGLAALIQDLPTTILSELYSKPLNTEQPLYFLSAYRKTDFISSIAAAIKESKVHFRSFDPAESPRLIMTQTINDVTSSAGVIVPFLEDYVDGSERHNIRAAFLSGLAHGLGREALLIRHQTREAKPAGADYRDQIVPIRSEAEVAEKVREFCAQALIAAQSIRKPRPLASRTALQRLTLGATAAENEFRTLEEYFYETSEFLRTARGEVSIVVGRKGSGKTAIFFMARNNFRKQRNSVVVDLRPESHQLSLFKSELSKIVDAGLFDHTLAAFWYFVIMSELLLALHDELEFQFKRMRRSELFDQVKELSGALEKMGISESGDFTVRINRLSYFIIQELKSQREPLVPERLTNIVYRGGIAEAKKLI